MRPFPPQHEKGHGRIETRAISISKTKPKTSFPFIEQAFRIDRVREIKGKIHTETVYGITSLSPQQADPLTLLDINRGHWSIENKLHYVRDVTFNEDRCRIRKRSGAHVMACLRNIVINLFRLWKINNIAQALRFFAWNAKDFILQLLGLQKNQEEL